MKFLAELADKGHIDPMVKEGIHFQDITREDPTVLLDSVFKKLQTDHPTFEKIQATINAPTA